MRNPDCPDFLKIPNHPCVLHRVRFPTISMDGEITPRPSECWSDTNCIAEYFEMKIHPWRGALCVAFDKAEFTNTGWESPPKILFPYRMHSVQRSWNAQTSPQTCWNSGLALGEVLSDSEPYQTKSNFMSSFTATCLWARTLLHAYSNDKNRSIISTGKKNVWCRASRDSGERSTLLPAWKPAVGSFKTPFLPTFMVTPDEFGDLEESDSFPVTSWASLGQPAQAGLLMAPELPLDLSHVWVSGKLGPPKCHFPSTDLSFWGIVGSVPVTGSIRRPLWHLEKGAFLRAILPKNITAALH